MHIGIIAYIGFDWQRHLYQKRHEPKEDPYVNHTTVDIGSETDDLHRRIAMAKLSIVGQGDI